MKHSLRVATCPLVAPTGPVIGRHVLLNGEPFYQIAHYDRMRPFFMTLVSASDHWMFISSTGGLTAGRRDPDLALFPYYTDDKLHDAAETTGSKAILIVRDKQEERLWEPFSERYSGLYRLERNLYKNAWGNQLVFEEVNHDLGLTFRYGWSTSDRFGFVRRATLSSNRATATRLRILDGLQNLMPWGVGSHFQLEKSTLLDAYKRNELVRDSGLGIFRLSSIPIDRPEPAEALRATTVWSIGLRPRRTLLSSRQLQVFRTGQGITQETDVRGERGAYFIQAELTLRAKATTEWWIVAELAQGAPEVFATNEQLRQPGRLRRLLLKDIAAGTEGLRKIIAGADGVQKSAFPLSDLRHAHNVLFNVMRGGVFDEGYRVHPTEVMAFVQNANAPLAARWVNWFRKLKPDLTYPELTHLAAQTGDRQLERLCREYLPLTFSRRHGDPSRPWNRFSIITRNPDGRRRRYYEGNWRDIFQNWEALARSYPDFVSGMIGRFVSASTADGYNPYRVTSDGIDWEVINPNDPWSHIGYWGDHQLIYLQKLLELLRAHDPDRLQDFLTRDLFAYANVPYRIHSYEELLRDPRETVTFDAELDHRIRERVKRVGADGKLVWDEERDQVRQVNLTEKLLVSILAKLANFVPEGGIWMNTQRPEWNDANNALVGNGLSVVTLCYLRRYVAFCIELWSATRLPALQVSRDVLAFLRTINAALKRSESLLAGPLSNDARRRVLDDLGRAGSRYRQMLYARGLSTERKPVRPLDLQDFASRALRWIDHSLLSNRRSDGLYHSYNLMRIEPDGGIALRRLYEMLEGQVAVLSSGYLKAAESVRLLSALKRSAMFRADQNSYLLYPNRELPRFLERNIIPTSAIKRSRLLRKLLTAGQRSLVEKDSHGQVHFSSALSNGRDVERVLRQLAAQGYGRLVRAEAAQIVVLFEKLFDHESFTGRSGTFFGYEGLGSIYWHMVSKLLLAVQETFTRSAEADQVSSVGAQQQLAEAYYDIRAGVGDQKSPAEYGAFPMDAYSHTPAHAGARQPGLTGQVKEDILCRWGELGVQVRSGQLVFSPELLRATEFLSEPQEFCYYDVGGTVRRLRLPKGALAFTYCSVPIVYRLGTDQALTLLRSDGRHIQSSDLQLDRPISQAIFRRDGSVSRIDIQFSPTPA